MKIREGVRAQVEWGRVCTFFFLLYVMKWKPSLVLHLWEFFMRSRWNKMTEEKETGGSKSTVMIVTLTLHEWCESNTHISWNILTSKTCLAWQQPKQPTSTHKGWKAWLKASHHHLSLQWDYYRATSSAFYSTTANNQWIWQWRDRKREGVYYRDYWT